MRIKKSVKLNAILNVIKQMCSVLFPLITIPYVTRVLQADNLGKVNFSTSVISYFLLIAQMGITNYAIREGAKVRYDKEKLNKLSNEVYSINIITTLLSYILLFLCICLFRPLQNYKLLLIIQSATIICTTIGADWVNNIFEDFWSITIRTIFVQILSLILMFIFVHDSSDYIMYAITVVLAQCGALIINSYTIRKYIRLHICFSRDMLRHVKPILYLFFNNVAMTIYINSGDSAVAIYYIATKIYGVVKNVINAIIVVALPKLSAYVETDKQSYERLCGQIFSCIITILLPAVMGLFCCSSLIVRIIAGKEFVAGAMPLQILSIALLFAVIGGFNTLCIVIPNRKEKILLLATSLAAIVNIALNFILIKLWSYNGAAITTVIAEFIVCVITFIGMKQFINFVLSKRTIISVLLGCIYIAIACILSDKILNNDFMSLFFSVVLSVLGYVIILNILKNPLIMSIRTKFKEYFAKLRSR